MIAHIAKFEWLRQLRSKTQLLLLLLAGALLLSTIYTHWRQQLVLSEAQHHWQQTADALWASQPDRHPHRVAHYGHVVVRPQAPLSFIEPGVTPYVGNYLFLEAHRQNSSSVQSTTINPVTLRLGYPSAALIMLVVWPLLLIVLGYGAFSNEWDCGRLFWLSSLGASAWQLFVGKMYGLLIHTLTILLAIVALGFTLLMSSEGVSTGTAIDFISLVAVFAGYSFAWVVAILAISFFSKNSQQSLWRLLTAWLLLCLVIPKTATGVAEQAFPTPDRANFDATVEKAAHAVGDAHNPNDPHFGEFKAKVLAQYDVSSIEELPVNWNGLVMAESERITSEIFQRHYNQVLEQFEAQDKTRLWFGFASPVVAIQNLSQKIAHTDRRSIQHFEASAEAFRFELIQKLNHLHSHEIHRANDRSSKLSAAVWQRMALFAYSPVERNPPSLLSLAALFFWGVVLLATLNAIRYRAIAR